MTAQTIRRPGHFTIGVRARILTTVLILAGLGMLVAGAASAAVTSRQLTTALDAALSTEVDEFRGHVDRAAADPRAATDVRSLLRTALERQVPMRDQVVMGMVDGVPSLVTPGKRPFPIEREAALVARIAALPVTDPIRIRQDTSVAVGPIRYVAIQVRVAGRPQRGTFVVATSLRPVHDTVVRGMRQYAVLSAAALLLIGVGGWLVAGRLLRPLRLLRQATERISHTDLTSRIPVTGRDDVTELTRTLNDMLDRLQWAFDAQQQFLDDAGHELRTPLTIVRGHLEVLDPADPAEVVATRDMVMDELDRMARLVNDLVMLAQARRPDFLRCAPVQVDPLLRDVLGKAEALADRRWTLDSGLPVTVLADAQRLTQAMLQLADNAVKHTGPDDVIAFGGAEAPSGVRLWVRDSGTGVAEADAERIFERFKRSGTSRGVDGSGLGLSIVAGIAAAHGGRVTLEQARPGARFVLTLPLTVLSRSPQPPEPPDRPTAGAVPADEIGPVDEVGPRAVHRHGDATRSYR